MGSCVIIRHFICDTPFFHTACDVLGFGENGCHLHSGTILHTFEGREMEDKDEKVQGL